MKKIQDGICYGNYDIADDSCLNQCYISFACSNETCRSKSKKEPNIIKKTVDLSMIHNIFINLLTELFPRVQNDVYPEKGIVHEYFNKEGILLCRIKTNFPQYNMQIDIINHEVFTWESLKSETDAENLYQKIRAIVQ